jgi:hypothetical protein
MEYLEVKNWQKFQHYKDRNPPWIKLHFEIMTSEDWVMLADASKLLAVVCMMIASRNEGRVPNNPHYIKRVAYLDAAPDLQPLINSGFLIKLLADDSELLADARPETYKTDTEKEKNTKKEKNPPEGFDAFWETFPTQRKGSREKTEAAYRQALKRTSATPDEILKGTRAYADSAEVLNGYAKGAAAWLNDDRWTTDYSRRPAKAQQPPEEKPRERIVV